MLNGLNNQMEHVFFGYGYCAKFLAKYLPSGIAISRREHPEIAYIQHDIASPGLSLPMHYVMYYFVPPTPGFSEDIILKSCLENLPYPPKKIIYIGSSGIYGDHQGRLINEQAPCHIDTPRQQQRQSAETLLTNYTQKHHIPCALLRVAGIYGPDRLPLSQEPIISPAEAPLINHIFIEDLAEILQLLGTEVSYHGILNIADGQPQPMGYLQQQVAMKYALPMPHLVSFQEAWNRASAMKKEFMSQNKQLSIQRLLQILKPYHLAPKSISAALEIF